MSLFDSFKNIGDPLNTMGGGLLWKPIKKATGLTDAQMIGLGAMAVAAPYALPAMGAMGGAGAAGAASQAMNIAGQTRAMTQGQPMQAPQAQFAQGPGFAGLLTPTEQVDPEKRRQAQQMAVQGLLGGYRG